MARIAALNGAGSFSQAVTTWDSSCNETTGICESLCVSPFEFSKESGVFCRFKSCRSDHFSPPGVILPKSICSIREGVEYLKQVLNPKCDVPLNRLES